MDHNFIDIDQFQDAKSIQILERSNNIDQYDNLDDLPGEQAVFAICGRVNGLPANPRLVGSAENLREYIRSLFTEEGPFDNDCIKEFMLSIKTKHLLYVTLADASTAELEQKTESWKDQLNPRCEEAMNEVF